LQLLVVPVSPRFTATTSHNVVRASYSATSGLPLTMNVAFSFVIGTGGPTGTSGAAKSPSAPNAVSAIPDAAALTKCLREYLISILLAWSRTLNGF
jgi:hypothetical protein